MSGDTEVDDVARREEERLMRSFSRKKNTSRVFGGPTTAVNKTVTSPRRAEEKPKPKPKPVQPKKLTAEELEAVHAREREREAQRAAERDFLAGKRGWSTLEEPQEDEDGQDAPDAAEATSSFSSRDDVLAREEARMARSLQKQRSAGSGLVFKPSAPSQQKQSGFPSFLVSPRAQGGPRITSASDLAAFADAE